MSHYKRSGRWLSILLVVGMLWAATPMPTQAQTTTPDIPLSPIEQIEQMEAEDEANGTIDGRNAPYVVVEVTTLDRQLFLPLLAGGADGFAVTSDAVDMQSAWNEIYWPPDAPPRPSLTPEQQAELEASNAAAEAYVRGLVTEVVSAAGVDAVNVLIRKSASVGDLNTWKEPNDQAHRNYCGPATIQVTIDAQIPKSMVPNIEAVKDRINLLTPGGFNPDTFGTTDVAMCRYLWDHYVNVIRFGERYFAQPLVGAPQQTLWNQLVRHVDKNYTVPTGAMSGSLKDWGRDSRHIVALVGYDASLENGIYPVAMHQMRYTETSGSVAGYNGAEFKIWHPGTSVWNAINQPNVHTQCVLKDGV